jgi:anti-sigma B factor antagonist
MKHDPVQNVRLEVSNGSSDKVQIIKVIGHLTGDNFFDFQVLTRKRPFPPIMLVDLTETPYIDSAALGCLVGLHVSCEASHRKYALVNANEQLQKLFEMTNVSNFLVLYNSVAMAEAALS